MPSWTRAICLSCRHAIRISSDRGYSSVSGLATIQTSYNGAPPVPMEGDLPELEETLNDQINLFSPVDMLRAALSPQKQCANVRQPLNLLDRSVDAPLTDAMVEIQNAFLDARKDRSRMDINIQSDAFHGTVGRRAIRAVLRKQLSACLTSRDMLRIVAIAMQKRERAVELAQLHQQLMSALYQIRENTPDPKVLSTISIIITRFRKAGLPVHYDLLGMGLKFAARSRELPAMKRYLREFQERGLPLKVALFRGVIAKFSIGARGLGEIRNGKWKRSDLLQVLLGFPDTPAEEAHHLGVFLDRNSWEYLHGWVAVLARCKAKEEVWKEWEIWRGSAERKEARPLLGPASGRGYTTRTRGDQWFVEQLLHADDPKRAWEVLKVSELPFALLRPAVKSTLLDYTEYATVWDDEVREALKAKYVADLERIEQILGVEWVLSGEDGYHVLKSNPEDVLERLADPELLSAHGFPVDEDIANSEHCCSDLLSTR